MENARCGHCLIVEKLGLPVWKKGTKTQVQLGGFAYIGQNGWCSVILGFVGPVIRHRFGVEWCQIANISNLTGLLCFHFQQWMRAKPKLLTFAAPFHSNNIDMGATLSPTYLPSSLSGPIGFWVQMLRPRWCWDVNRSYLGLDLVLGPAQTGLRC